jgi:hypothetical protein
MVVFVCRVYGYMSRGWRKVPVFSCECRTQRAAEVDDVARKQIHGVDTGSTSGPAPPVSDPRRSRSAWPMAYLFRRLASVDEYSTPLLPQLPAQR